MLPFLSPSINALKRTRKKEEEKPIGSLTYMIFKPHWLHAQWWTDV